MIGWATNKIKKGAAYGLSIAMSMAVPFTSAPPMSHEAYAGTFESSGFVKTLFDGESLTGALSTKRAYSGPDYYDYYSLRALSRQLYIESMIGAMIVDRMVTNVIHSGLDLNPEPDQRLIGIEDDEKYFEKIDELESLFELWAEDEEADWSETNDLGTLEHIAYVEAFIEGDILRMERIDRKTLLPKIALISGRHVRNMPESDAKKQHSKNTVRHGVEKDRRGRVVAFHVNGGGDTGVPKLVIVKARNRKGRLIANLVTSEPLLPGMTRGRPLLSRIIQPANQIDKFIGYEMEAAKLNAKVAMWIENSAGEASEFNRNNIGAKLQDKDANGKPTEREMFGAVISGLAKGEKINSHDTARPNIGGAKFIEAILNLIAASMGIPPSILKLMFSSNYSASRGEIIEFNTGILKNREFFAKQFSKRNYRSWLYCTVTKGDIKAGTYRKALGDDNRLVKKAWEKCVFTGYIKPHLDPNKETKPLILQIDEGLTTRERSSRALNGTSARLNMKRLIVENKALAEARAPLLGAINTSKKGAPSTTADKASLKAMVDEIFEDKYESYIKEELSGLIEETLEERANSVPA